MEIINAAALKIIVGALFNNQCAIFVQSIFEVYQKAPISGGLFQIPWTAALA